MRSLSMMALVLTGLAASPAVAAEAKIDITSPADGSVIKAGMPNPLAYEFTMGGDADHAHLYVDGNQAALLRQAKGSYMLEPMAAGMHEICARLVNKFHTPTGVESCVKVTVE